VALGLLLTASLAACSISADEPAEGDKLTPVQLLAAAKAKADAATSMHLTLSSSGIPESAAGVLAAEGSGTHAPAFKGTLDARISGVQAKVDVVALDNVLYVKLPFTTKFAPIDPKAYNAPNPAQLFATEGGITSLITATTSPVEGKATRAGADVLRTISGKLPGESVAKLLNIGDASKPFDVTYGITDPGGELRSVTMTGPFYQDATATPATGTPATSTPATSATVTSTYTLTLDKYGAPVEISKP
jgi:lipoprotein LprG